MVTAVTCGTCAARGQRRTIGGMLKMILYLHIAGGSAALLSMFIPLVARKGGRTHRRSGWVFVGGMSLVSVTALALSAARYLFDPRPEAKAFALFLFYIAILTGSAVSTGVRVLRTKDRTGAHTHRVGCRHDIAAHADVDRDGWYTASRRRASCSRRSR